MEFNEDGSLKIPEIKEESLDKEEEQDIVKKAKEFELTFDKIKYQKALEEINIFNNKFPRQSIKELNLQTYCTGFTHSFSYFIDRGTKEVALIAHQGFNQEFGLWYNSKEDKYYIRTNRAKMVVEEKNAKSRLEEIKINIISALDYADKEQFIKIDEIKMPWHQVKMKIIYLYHSDKLIPIMSKEQIEFICKKFNVIYYPDSPIYSCNKLIKKIRKVEIMKNWHSQKIAQFMYHNFPQLKQMMKDNN